MELRSFETVMGALNERGVRYLLVGGMAVGRPIDRDDVIHLRMLQDG